MIADKWVVSCPAALLLLIECAATIPAAHLVHQSQLLDVPSSGHVRRTPAGVSLAHYALGRSAESDVALKKLISTHQKDCAYQIAETYAYWGETGKAFQWLDRAVQQHDPGAPELKTDPLMKSLRQDPRYAELLKKMRLSA